MESGELRMENGKRREILQEIINLANLENLSFGMLVLNQKSNLILNSPFSTR